MQEHTATVVEHQRLGHWSQIVLSAPALVNLQPGQYVALRCAAPGSYDPLIRLPLFVANTDIRAQTINLLVAQDDPTYTYIAGQPAGAALNLLAPLGHGWQLGPTARTLVLAGLVEHAAALFGLAQQAVRRGLAVSLLLGERTPDTAPPPFILPADAEYNVVREAEDTEQPKSKKRKAQRNESDTGAGIQHPDAKLLQALGNQLSDDTLRWADILALGLPQEILPVIAQRIRSARLNWNEGMAQALLLPPPACHVGVCGVCSVPTRQGYRLACVDGPVFDLLHLAR